MAERKADEDGELSSFGFHEHDDGRTAGSSTAKEAVATTPSQSPAASTAPTIVRPHAIRPNSPPAVHRPTAQRPTFLRSHDSLESLNSSLSFLLHEAAMQEGERRRAKSRQSQRARQDVAYDNLDAIRRARSPWFASEAIRAAAAADDSSASSALPSPALLTPDRQHAKSTPLEVHHHRLDVPSPQMTSDAAHTPPSAAQADPNVRRARTPFHLPRHHGATSRPSSAAPTRVGKTPIPDHQTAELTAQLQMLRMQHEHEESLILQRMRKAASLRSPTPATTAAPPVRPLSVRPTTETENANQANDDDDDVADDHMLLKGDEHDEQVLAKTRSRSGSSVTGSTSSAYSTKAMTDEEQLQAIVEEFGPMKPMDNGPQSPERLLTGQGAVLVRRVLVRGYMALTTHRLCFLAILPTNPTRHRILQQGPAVIHRPGLTRRKRRAWFTLSADSITAYPSSTELYEPLGGVRLVDVDDVQPAPQDKSVHFRIKGKKCSLEFDTEEAAMEWQRQIDAALFLYTHNVDKIRVSIPLVRIAQAVSSPILGFANTILVDVLDTDAPHHRHTHRLHLHKATDESEASSIKDLVFSLIRADDKISPQLDDALAPWKSVRAAMDRTSWHTLPGALIDIDGPRIQPEAREESKGTGAVERQKVFIEQFALDCEPEQVQVFRAHLVRTFPLTGSLAVAPQHLCFYRHHRFTGLADTRIRIPFEDIQGAYEGKAFLWHHHGLNVRVRAHGDLVFEMRDKATRDQVLQLIKSASKSAEKEDESSGKAEEKQKDDEEEEEGKVKRKNSSRLSSFVAHQQRHVQITVPPDQINLLPRTINVRRPGHIAVNSMKIHCLTIGSRGDVQPYVALCKRLQQRDHHTCTIVSHPEYREWVEENGIAFREVGGDPGELMKLSVENNKMLFSPQFYREAMSKFRNWLDELLRGIMETCWDADLIIESPSTFGGIHVAEAVGCYYMRAFTMPWTKTSAYPQAFSVPNVDLGPQYNAMSYTMFDQVLWLASSGQINRWRKHMLHLGPTDLAKMDQQSVPFMYNFSPAVVPPPLDWGDRIKVTGYWTLSNDSKQWNAPDDLIEFIDKAHADGKKLCYIGFGSITMPNPIDVQRSIYEAVQRADVRAIVSKGWSARMIAKKESEGESVELHVPAEVYSVDSIPHDWLFPRIDIAMHHGGAGTTGASLKAGLITLIHPFFGDQFFWSGRVAKLGAGLRVKSLQTSDLADALSRARDGRLMREKAEQVGESIRQEHGVDEAIAFMYYNLSRAKRVKHALGASSSSSTSTSKRPSMLPCRPSDDSMDVGTEKSAAAATQLAEAHADVSKEEGGHEEGEEQRRYSLSSLLRTNSIKAALPVEKLRRANPLSTSSFGSKERTDDSATDGSKSSSTRTSKELERQSSSSKRGKGSTRDTQATSTVPSDGEAPLFHELKKTESPTHLYADLPSSSSEAKEGGEEEESEAQTGSSEAEGALPPPPPPSHGRRSWYSSALHLGMPSMNALSMPSLSMPHMNFFDVRLHGIHLSHRGHAEAAASAKEQMSEEERRHAQKEDKKRHISAKQEDQCRRQALEAQWRKAKRFDLLDNAGRLDVQPEEDEDEEEESDDDEDDGDQEAALAKLEEYESDSAGVGSVSGTTAFSHDGSGDRKSSLDAGAKSINEAIKTATKPTTTEGNV